MRRSSSLIRCSCPTAGWTWTDFWSYLHIHVSAAALIHVEVDDFWTETGLHLDVHLVAGLHQLLGQIQVISWEAMVSTKSQKARQKTHQMVLKDQNTRTKSSPDTRSQEQVQTRRVSRPTHHFRAELSMRKLSNEGEAAGGRPLQQVLLHTLDGLQIVLQKPPFTIQGGEGKKHKKAQEDTKK